MKVFIAFIILCFLLIWDLINGNNKEFFEGHSGQSTVQTKFLQDKSKNSSVKNILEIGFNAGHSSRTFLESNKNVHVTSFDLGVYNYKPHKSEIDNKYPDRHTLIIGNSLDTIPKFNNDKKYDLIFFDGGHEYNVSYNDLKNCKRLAHSDTLVIMDDVVRNKKLSHFNLGPNKAWSQMITDKEIIELGQIDISDSRGFAYGRYIL